MQILIRKCCESESIEIFSQIARLHKQEISQGSIAKWSLKALSELYRFLAAYHRSFIYIALQEGRVVGFIAGCESTKSLFRDFLKSNFLQNLILFIPEILSPQRFRKAVETLLYPSRRRADKALPEPEIINFCVDNKRQRDGLGGRLFDSLIDEFQKRGVQKIGIITGMNQESAQRFYIKRGAKKVAETELHAGVKSVAYEYSISRSTKPLS